MAGGLAGWLCNPKSQPQLTVTSWVIIFIINYNTISFVVVICYYFFLNVYTYLNIFRLLVSFSAAVVVV